MLHIQLLSKSIPHFLSSQSMTMTTTTHATSYRGPLVA